jgi:nucleoside-diphosphate-sugar epimerase
MRIFLTGATGYIGSAVLDALIRGGHQITALVRDNEKAARVSARGAGRAAVRATTLSRSRQTVMPGLRFLIGELSGVGWCGAMRARARRVVRVRPV